MGKARVTGARLIAAAAAAGLVLTPAIVVAQAKKRAPAISLSFDPLTSFTPANADPRLAAALGARGGSVTDFKFTPAASKSRPSQVRVAIRARAGAPASVRSVELASAPTPVTLTPARYNLGVAVGWRKFAVAGDVARNESSNPALGGRESAVVGVSYALNKKLTTRVAVGADRDDGRAIAALRNSDNYSLDVGGAYSISKRVAITGGVRYRIDEDRLQTMTDNRRDSQAVYVGTAVKF